MPHACDNSIPVPCSLLVEQISSDRFADYASISPELTVTSVLEYELVEHGLGGIVLRETPVAQPYRKYPYENDECFPQWMTRYDMAAWGVFLATDGGRPVGGAVVAPVLPDMSASQYAKDVAVLWDIRVSPADRGKGVGTALLKSCALWARERGHGILSIETQNNNVPACRFYAKMGCELATVRRFGYAHCPEVAREAMLIWQLKL